MDQGWIADSSIVTDRAAFGDAPLPLGGGEAPARTRRGWPIRRWPCPPGNSLCLGCGLVSASTGPHRRDRVSFGAAVSGAPERFRHGPGVLLELRAEAGRLQRQVPVGQCAPSRHSVSRKRRGTGDERLHLRVDVCQLELCLSDERLCCAGTVRRERCHHLRKLQRQNCTAQRVCCADANRGDRDPASLLPSALPRKTVLGQKHIHGIALPRLSLLRHFHAAPAGNHSERRYHV